MILRPFVCLLAVWLASAQELTLRPTLQAGDSFQLEYTRIIEDSRRPQANGRIRAFIAVHVLEANPKGFLLRWTSGASSVDNPEIVRNPVAAAAASALKDHALEVQLGPDGQYLGLRNQAATAARLQAAMDKMLESLGRQFTDPAQRQSVEGLVRRLMSPQVLLGQATRDVQTYFALNGIAIAAGKPAVQAIEQPAPFGGGTLAATYTLALDSMDAHSARLSSATAYDSEELSRMASRFFAQLTAGSQAPAAPPALEMADSAAYTYNRAYGLMSDILVRRRLTGAGGMNRLEGWDVKLMRHPGEDGRQ